MFYKSSFNINVIPSTFLTKIQLTVSFSNCVVSEFLRISEKSLKRSTIKLAPELIFMECCTV